MPEPDLGAIISAAQTYGDDREALGKSEARAEAEAAAQVKLDALQAEFDAYRASHPDQPQPEPARKTIIGMSAPASQWSARLAEVGANGVKARRIFADLAKGAGDQMELVKQAKAAGMLPVVSYKVGGDVAGAKAGRFDDMAREAGKQLAALGVEVRVAIWHEPNGDVSPADFVTINKRLIPLIRSERVKLGCFLNGFLLDRQQATLTAFMPDDLVALYEWVGIDAYHAGSPTNAPAPPALGTPGSRVRQFAAYCRDRGITKPIGFGEYNGYTAAALVDAGEAILSDPDIEFACMWNSQVSGEADLVLRGDRLAAFQATKSDPRAQR